MMAFVYTEHFLASALPHQCVFTWYRREDQTVILEFVKVPPVIPSKTRFGYWLC